MSKYLKADQEGINKISQALIDNNALMFGKIIPSMNIVPFYPETRWLFSNPDSFRIVVEEMGKLVKKLNVDLLAGCEFAGMPLAAAVSLESNIPTIYIRKKPKNYGSKKLVVGKVKGKNACLIDDATGMGAGKEVFAKALEDDGIKVTDMAVIYWTGHPLVTWYQEMGIKHHSLMLFEDFAHYARDVGYISETLYDLIWDWYKDYNIQKRSLDFKRFDQVLAQAKKEGFSIMDEDKQYEQIVQQSKDLGKWYEPPENKYEYI